ncbi:hypothetical protein C1D09_003475 [Mesorhizobium intechi]|uniref:hypothetical protein n=1 Tax=Mesorhizobium intechi TaxID=537601 RepID=UPI000CC5B76D|nr:hypothetical protein [Mesorhizobium intechi]TSE13548.1 hypothetical protein C1D09_003475 [Mesorhizobium intechi]
MKDTIATWALYFSIASFALYLATAVAQLIAQLKTIHDGAPSTQAVPNVSGFLTVVKDLVEALSKASPSLVALIASIAYLALAGMAVGVFGTG